MSSVSSPSQLRYYDLNANLLTANTNNISVIKSKNLKLIDFGWSVDGCDIPPAIELVEGLPLKYEWSEDSEMGSNKICLALNEASTIKEFFERIETRAIELASEMSESITGSHFDAETIRSFKWFSNTEQVKLTFDASKCPTFTLDKDDLLTKTQNIRKIEKGSTIFAVISIKRMWYADQFGIQYAAEAIAVRSPGPKPFDFILNTAKTFSSNRLLKNMDYTAEMDFDHEIYNHPSYGSPMYFFNMRKAEIGRMKAPFGVNVEDPSTGSGTLSLDINDESVSTFFKALDVYITDQVSERFSKWFSMKSKMPMTGDRLRQFLYIPTVRVSKQEQYANKLKFKIFIDPSNTRKYTEVFIMQPDGSHVKGTYEDITQQCGVVPQFVIDYLWFKGSKNQITSFGTTMSLRRVLVYPGVAKSHNITSFHGFSMKKRKATDMISGGSREPCPADADIPQAKMAHVDADDDDTGSAAIDDEIKMVHLPGSSATAASSAPSSSTASFL